MKCAKRFLVLLAGVLINGRMVCVAETPRNIAQKSFPSVVLLVMHDTHGQPLCQGSGFFVAEDIIASNYHVVDGSSGGSAKIVGRKDKFKIEGIVAQDPSCDIVLLKIGSPQATQLQIGDSSALQVGDEIYAIGNPLGLEGTMSQGIISGVRSIGNDTLLQITAPISPGSSGGPVLNSQGEVVGISVAAFKGGQNLNFAIPSRYLTRAIEALGPVVPFHAVHTNRATKSFVDSLAEGKSLDGVKIKDFEMADNGWYKFVIKNNLDEPVSAIRWRIIYYGADGDPVHYIDSGYSGVVAARLAKSTGMWQGDLAIPKFARYEIRLLDFRVGEVRADSLFGR